MQFNIIDKPDTILDHYSQSCLKCDTYTSWSQSYYRQPLKVVGLLVVGFLISRNSSSVISREISAGCLEHFPAERPVTLTEKRNIQKLTKLSCNTLRIQFHVIKINESTQGRIISLEVPYLLGNPGEVLPIMTYTGRLRQKGIPLSGAPSHCFL